MIVTPYKTPKIEKGADLYAILDASLPKLEEKDVVVITSKIISICEGNLIKNDGTVDKRDLIHKESQFYMEEECLPKYGIILTIKDDTLIASAGIDESNGNGYYILWPKDSMKSAQEIWEYLRKKHGLQDLGVIIADSRVTAMRWGTTGIGIGWCGFEPLKNYIGSPDIFGHELRVTREGIMDGLAGAANIVMGEGDEQTPIVHIRDVPFVVFQNRPPNKEEVDFMRITKETDIYSPLTNSTLWKKGGK